jgi:hypothetical protein
MAEIMNRYLLDEYIKLVEKIPTIGFNKDVPTQINKITLPNGTIKNLIIGGKPRRILVI